MKKQITAELLKDLPMCPKGRLFVAEDWGHMVSVFFHSMSDYERTLGIVKNYSFTYKEILNNPKWFKIISHDRKNS